MHLLQNSLIFIYLRSLRLALWFLPLSGVSSVTEMGRTIKDGHGVCANVLVMVLFAAFLQAMVDGQAVVTISQPPPSDCPYPCLPPPTTPTIYPPPSQPQPLPPSEVYPPPAGYFPYYIPPPWYLGNAPPPPDPILPYYPWYYKHPLVPNSSSEIGHMQLWVMAISLLLMIVSLAISGNVTGCPDTNMILALKF